MLKNVGYTCKTILLCCYENCVHCNTYSHAKDAIRQESVLRTTSQSVAKLKAANEDGMINTHILPPAQIKPFRHAPPLQHRIPSSPHPPRTFRLMHLISNLKSASVNLSLVTKKGKPMLLVLTREMISFLVSPFADQFLDVHVSNTYLS